MARPTQEGARLLNQLVTLDVSTLITKISADHGVVGVQAPTGEKAPRMEVMVQNLADNYRKLLSADETAHFSELSDLAQTQRVQEKHTRHGLLDRVARNGRDLHDIVARAGSISNGTVQLDANKLQPEDAATIRKAWELALDPVDVGTNVSLIGDLTTRFSAHDGAPPPDAVVAFHGVMVDSGLREWDALMGVVSQFVATLASFFFG